MRVETHQQLETVDRYSAFTAALPLFLFGISITAIAIFLLVIGGPSRIINLGGASFWHNLALIVGVISLIVLICAAIAAMKSQLPIWSYTWIGAVLAGLIISLNLVLDEQVIMISKVVDIMVVIISLLSGLIIFSYAAFRGWQHTGLLSIGFCGTLGLSLCFFGIAGPFHFKLGLLTILIGLIEAVLVYFYIHRSNFFRVTIIIGVGCANIGISWIIESFFRSSSLSRDINQFWILAAILTGLLLGGTLLGIPGKLLYRMFRMN